MTVNRKNVFKYVLIVILIAQVIKEVKSLVVMMMSNRMS